jgi:hypothetical protein
LPLLEGLVLEAIEVRDVGGVDVEFTSDISFFVLKVIIAILRAPREIQPSRFLTVLILRLRNSFGDVDVTLRRVTPIILHDFKLNLAAARGITTLSGSR